MSLPGRSAATIYQMAAKVGARALRASGQPFERRIYTWTEAQDDAIRRVYRGAPDLGVTGVLEMPPAGTLTGIIKRALPGVETFALKTPDQVDAAREFCERHGESSGLDLTPTWRMVVSPAKGTFHLDAEAAELDVLRAGAAIGAVASLRDQISVTAAHGGQVVEWLVEDGDPVAPGQPLLRLHPEGAA